MTVLELFLLAVSLCFDTLAVSIAAGLHGAAPVPYQRVRFVLVLALCQTLMPLAGWLLGGQLLTVVGAAGRWVALALLCLVGGRMVSDAFRPSGSEVKAPDSFSMKHSVAVGIATSIDALAVGVSLAMVPARILLALSFFFFVTAAVAAAGLLLGARIARRCHSAVPSLVGGVVLVCIGLKIAFGG